MPLTNSNYNVLITKTSLMDLINRWIVLVLTRKDLELRREEEEFLRNSSYLNTTVGLAYT